MNRGIRGLALTVIGAVCLVAASAPAAAKGKDPFVGHWQYDAAKSTFTGGAPYQSQNVTVTAVKGGHKVSADLVTADGKTVHVEYGGPSDGSSLAVTGAMSFDSVTVLQPDKNTMVRTERRGGKVCGITTVVIDKNGKSGTATSRGTTPDGHQYTSVVVFNKVK
jgi:hypothetical protein